MGFGRVQSESFILPTLKIYFWIFGSGSPLAYRPIVLFRLKESLLHANF